MRVITHFISIACEDGDAAKFTELQDRMMKVEFATNSNLGLIKEKLFLNGMHDQYFQREISNVLWLDDKIV